MFVALTMTVGLAAPRSADLPRISPALTATPEGVQTVVLEVRGDPWDVVERLDEMGIEVEAWAPGHVQARVPDHRVADLQTIPSLVRARRPHLARPKGAEVRTEAYAGIFEDGDWHDAGHTGRGVRVAVLDVGFAGASALLGTELPSQVRTFYAHDQQSYSHGTAVAEVVHDIAPEAELWLYQFYTDVEFLAALDLLGEEDIDVANASIGFDNTWHADGSGPITRAVDSLAERRDLVWVGAAGNENDKYRLGWLTDSDGDGLVEIDGLEGVLVYAPGGDVDVSFRWSEDMEAAEVDIDLVVFEPGGAECARSEDPQDGPGSAPYERVSAACDASWLIATPVVDAPEVLRGLEGFLYGAWGIDEAAWTERRNLTLPADSRLGLAIGACDPETGEAPYYSSRGPTEDGRPKPDLCALGQVTTASIGDGHFAGTSASAPHVAGMSALNWAAFDLEDAESVRNIVRNRARDLGDTGIDTTFGHGALRAGRPPERCGCATAPRAFLVWLVTALALATRRRQTGEMGAMSLRHDG